MKWSNERKSNSESHYDHIITNTPLGIAIIEWKSWKDQKSYSVTINDQWINENYDSLEMAKLDVRDYLLKKYHEIGEFLNEG
jgi:hypothetical protein